MSWLYFPMLTMRVFVCIHPYEHAVKHCAQSSRDTTESWMKFFRSHPNFVHEWIIVVQPDVAIDTIKKSREKAGKE